MTTHKDARRNVARYPAIVGYLALLLMSGCGLAMDNEDRLARGEQAYADGDFRAAIIDAKDVLLDEPDNLRGRLLLGSASVRGRRRPRCGKGVPESDADGRIASGCCCRNGARLVVAAKIRRGLEEVPFEGLPSSEAEATVRIARGEALMGLRNPKRQEECIMSVLQLQPENLDARLGIVSSFVAEGNFVQARGALDQVLDTYAEYPRVWLYSGSLNMRAGDFEAARRNFEVALNLATSSGDEPARLQALAGLAESSFEQQDIDSARARIDQLAAASPESLADQIIDCAYCLLRRGLDNRTAESATGASGRSELSPGAIVARHCAPAQRQSVPGRDVSFRRGRIGTE